MRMFRLLVCASTLLLFPVTSMLGQGGVEDELEALVQATSRLVQVLERQEHDRSADSELRRVGLAVQILSIRAGQQEGLQKELRNLEDQEQRTRGNIASNEAKIETFTKQLSESSDDANRVGLQDEKDQMLVYLENNKKRLQHYAQRRVDLENRLIHGERLTREVESVVESWLEDLQSSPRKDD